MHPRLNGHEFEQAPGVGSAGKEFTCNVGDLGSIPELGRSPGEGKGYPLQYSGLENSMDCIVHGVRKSWHMNVSINIRKCFTFGFFPQKPCFNKTAKL